MSTKKKRRKSRWSKGSLPDQKKIKQRKQLERAYSSSPFDQSLVDSNSNSIDAHISHSSRSSSKASSELSVGSSLAKSSGYETFCGDPEDVAVTDNLEENSRKKSEDASVSCKKEVEAEKGEIKSHQFSDNPAMEIKLTDNVEGKNFETEVNFLFNIVIKSTFLHYFLVKGFGTF